MLPFIKRERPLAATSVVKRKPDGSSEESAPDNDDGLESCMTDFLRCANSNDTTGMAAAMRSAFEILDSEPHEEGPHTNEDKE